MIDLIVLSFIFLFMRLNAIEEYFEKIFDKSTFFFLDSVPLKRYNISLDLRCLGARIELVL